MTPEAVTAVAAVIAALGAVGSAVAAIISAMRAGDSKQAAIEARDLVRQVIQQTNTQSNTQTNAPQQHVHLYGLTAAGAITTPLQQVLVFPAATEAVPAPATEALPAAPAEQPPNQTVTAPRLTPEQ